MIEEITQLDSSLWADIAELSLNPKVKFLLLGDFPAAAGGAGRLRGRAGDEAPQELPAAPRPGGRLLSRAHGEPPERRGHLLLPPVLVRVDEAEEPPLQQALQMARERFPRRGQPDTCLVISHANRMRLNEQHNRKAGPGGSGDPALRGPGRRCGHQQPADHAGLAGPAPRGRGGQGGQGLLRH